MLRRPAWERCMTVDKYVIKGGTMLHGEVEISGAKNAAVAIIPAAVILFIHSEKQSHSLSPATSRYAKEIIPCAAVENKKALQSAADWKESVYKIFQHPVVIVRY